MNQLAKSAVALMFISVAAHAQNLETATGQWTGTTKSPSTGNDLQIQVKLSDGGGTWMYISHASTKKSSPCLGREFPLSVKTLPSSKLMFSVDGPSVITGCPSFTLTLERTDPETLTGSFGDGRPAVLKKQ